MIRAPRRSSIFVALVAFFLTGAVVRAGEPQSIWRGLNSYLFEGPPDTFAYERKATLAITGTTVKAGQEINVELRLVNTSDGSLQTYYNPFFNPLLPGPGALALFDSNKRFLYNLIAFRGGSRQKPEEGERITMPGHSSTARVFQITLPRLIPGKYYLQMILYHALFTYIPPGEFDVKEGFRSNRIELEVVR